MSKNNIQHFDWGQIEWVYEPEYGNSSNIMNIGIVSILPGKRQTRHVHYGDEQFLYVISGEGKQLIDYTENIIGPGAIFHIDAGSVHETVNMGDEPIVELLISIPANLENNLLLKSKAENLLTHREECESSIKLDDRIKGINDKFLNSLKIPLSIFDDEDNVVVRGQGYPEYCEVKCNIGEKLNNCCIYRIRSNYTAPQYPDPSAYICPFGLTVFIVPILFNYKVIGKIKGGHIKTSSIEPNVNQVPDMNYELIPVVPKARMKAISLQLRKLTESIADYYIIENTEVELDRKEEIIQDIFRHETMLEESLKSSQEKVLNIQINNHFLFNTLNALAGLAVKENAYKTYESIISLSKMFRYSLKTGSNLVTLRDELDYLVDFIDLQKLRYSERLEVRFSIAEEIKDIILPFHCLQPILENCFIHGFKDKTDKMLIEVSGIREQNSTVIEIRDNGAGMDGKAEDALNRMIKLNSKGEVPSGLMMIYSKLQLYYNQGFDFEVSGKLNKGTIVKLTIYDKLLK